jgi:hypothetical protein
MQCNYVFVVAHFQGFRLLEMLEIEFLLGVMFDMGNHFILLCLRKQSCSIVTNSPSLRNLETKHQPEYFVKEHIINLQPILPSPAKRSHDLNPFHNPNDIPLNFGT